MKLIGHGSLALAFLAWPVGALAHPLDVYLQATLVDIAPDEVRLQINLTPGVQVADQVLGLIDRNRDGAISTNEAAAYAALLQRELLVRLDGRNVEPKLAASVFPEPAEIRTGWGIIQLEYTVAPIELAAGLHKFTLENRHQPVASAYLFNAARPASAFIQIAAQKRNDNQSTGEISFEYHPPTNPLARVGLAAAFGVIFTALCVGLCRSGKKRKYGLQENRSRLAANLSPQR